MFWWTRWFSSLIWDWVQVEITTRCNARCSYCPRTVYGPLWPERDLTVELFLRLARDLPRSRYIHLQGWGEPLLHPCFFDMAALAKKTGCQLGTTTNGTLVDRRVASKLVELDFRIVALSLAGTASANDTVRKGAPLEKVIQAMEHITAVKRRKKAKFPEIHIAYMLFKSNLAELKGLPELLKGLDVAQVVISSLDYLPEPALEKEVIEKGDPEALFHLQEVQKDLVSQGIELHHNLDPRSQGIMPCTENVLKAMVIGANGDVAPCVYTSMDLPGAHMWRKGLSYEYKRISFGNLNERTLKAIWDDPRYRDFRRSFSQGPIEEVCTRCPKRCTDH